MQADINIVAAGQNLIRDALCEDAFWPRPGSTVIAVSDMFSQIQKMQADMQAAQDALANTTVEGSAGGGVVKAKMTGDGELRSITIDPSVVDPGDVETLEDLVVAAVHDAAHKAKDMQSQKLGAATGGLDLDSMLGSLGGLGGLLGGDSDSGPHL